MAAPCSQYLPVLSTSAKPLAAANALALGTTQATTRATETSKCADADAAARNACRNAAAAGSLDATGLTQCLAASDAAAVQCKVAMETAVRSCMEAFSCNVSVPLQACRVGGGGSEHD